MESLESLLTRLRAAQYFDENSGRNKKYRVHPPANAKLRREVTAWANGRLPAELDAFLALTAGFEGSAGSW